MARRLSLPHDCQLPQLREIVDETRLRETIGAVLCDRDGAPRITIERCRLEQLHYRMGSGCRVCVSATLRRAGVAGTIEQMFAGRVMRNGDSEHAFMHASMRPLSRPSLGPPLLHLAQWGLVLWAFPNDPELPGLALLGDGAAVRTRLAASPARFGLPGAPEAVTPRLVKYVPERRCGYRYDVTVSGVGTSELRSVYAKAYRGKESFRAHALLERIAGTEASRRGDVIVPRPLGHDAEAGVVWQSALAGRPILKDRSDPGRLERAAGEIGTRLAALHDCGATLPAEMTLDFERRRLRGAIDTMRGAFGTGAARSTAVAERLLDAASSLEPAPDVCLHGSFKMSHVLGTPDGVAFIDLDGANRGDAASDLGCFVAHVVKMEVSGRLEPARAARAIADFRAGYDAAATHTVARERVEWAAASQLIAGAMDKSVKRMDARWVGELTAAAERLCPA